ncbi:hypothetical protein Bca52824_059032 [Brassica carinata]|uniref:Uncharacterized protein n=1 Tax=Brassica carinata TaxID=52824 RepID=A0A8X7QV42_BRACI|nr:hypothetical protein Bca52824_059032 [Brassica carinata]
MNFLVEKYDSALKQTMIQLGSSEKLSCTRLKVIESKGEHKKANEGRRGERDSSSKVQEPRASLSLPNTGEEGARPREKSFGANGCEPGEGEDRASRRERDVAVDKLMATLEGLSGFGNYS